MFARVSNQTDGLLAGIDDAPGMAMLLALTLEVVHDWDRSIEKLVETAARQLVATEHGKHCQSH